MRNYLSSAIAYIQENGDELERARLTGLLGRARPEAKVARTLLARQHEDGGFPYGMIAGRPSATTSTATALQWMQDLHLLVSPFAERAVAYLLTVQHPEGSWIETPAVIKYNPPPHARPDHAAGRIYCTALATFWLARLAGPRHDAVLRGTDYLRAQRDGGWPADEPAQIASLVTASLAIVDGLVSRAASAGIYTLGRLSPHAWTADGLAETLTAFYAARFDADDPLVAWGLRRLLSAQQVDGGWHSELGSDRDVDLSLRALGSLLAFGVSSSYASRQ